MARKRKPCEFCETEWVEQISLPNVDCHLENYPLNNTLYIWLASKTDDGEMNGEDDFTIEMNYCPVCGRKVGY